MLNSPSEHLPAWLNQQQAGRGTFQCHLLDTCPERQIYALSVIGGEARVLGPLMGKASPSFPSRAEAYIRHEAPRHFLLS